VALVEACSQPREAARKARLDRRHRHREPFRDLARR
jgi:hypothetical protein